MSTQSYNRNNNKSTKDEHSLRFSNTVFPNIFTYVAQTPDNFWWKGPLPC